MKLSEIVKSANTVIHCMTENAAKELCEEFHKLGLTWCSNLSYKDDTKYRYYKENTCYIPAKGTYADVKYCENKSFKIIPFSKVEFDNIEPKTSTARISEQPESIKSKDIDWERRRYEISKDILANLTCQLNADDPDLRSKDCQMAIACADELIKHLKN